MTALCISLRTCTLPAASATSTMPDHSPATLVDVFHRGQKRTRSARGIWKSHARQSAASRRVRTDSAAANSRPRIPLHQRLHSYSSSVASSSSTGSCFDHLDVLDVESEGRSYFHGDALSLSLGHPRPPESESRRRYKRQRRSSSKGDSHLCHEEEGSPCSSVLEPDPGRRFSPPPRKTSSFASSSASSSLLSSSSLEDAKSPPGTDMNTSLPVPLDQRLSDKRTKTTCDWRDWEDLKETFASAAEDCECAHSSSVSHLQPTAQSLS